MLRMMLRKLSLLLVLALPACDPCTGVGACDGPQVRYEGTVNKLFSNPQGPAEGIRVKFVRTAGVELEADSLVAHSDATGRFRLEGRTNPSPLGGRRMYRSGETPERRHRVEWEVCRGTAQEAVSRPPMTLLVLL